MTRRPVQWLGSHNGPMFRSILYSLIVAALLASGARALAQAPAPPSEAGAPAPGQAAPGPEASAQGGPPPPTFPGEANFVEGDAVFSDAMGNPGADLGAAD